MNSYADSWLTINGRPWLRFRGRNTVEFILLCISAAAIPITLLTIVIIIRTTPEKLKRYQWILLNLTITIFLADVTICFLFDPITLFPEIACYSESWFANISEDANYILFIVFLFYVEDLASSPYS
ncbi:hypothetical protein GCK32_018895 [Trichostrongylus colubriformis]|uniref:Uncharacterized protein n=1 Tax=Trichostrongylus colubriformis TaxID=6319 RepID=A0AAN8ITK7_TRICO